MSGTLPPAEQSNGNSRSYVRFIVLCGGRTGSYMLGTSLNYNPKVVCFGEVFHPLLDYIDYHIGGYDKYRAEDLTLRKNDLHGFLDKCIFRSYPSETSAVGFKAPINYLWLIPDVLEWLVSETDIRVVHLQRRNLLRMLVSLKIAMETGGWTDYQGHTLASLRDPANVVKALRRPLRAALALRKLVFPKKQEWKATRSQLMLTEKECRAYFATTAENVTNYDARFDTHPKMTLYYEDLVEDYKNTLDTVQTFLGLRPVPLVPMTRKQNPEPLRELIANHDELKAAFAGEPEAAYFD